MQTVELIQHNIDTLKEAVAFLGTITARQYIHQESSAATSSVGKHIRHIIDHYSSFVSGIVISKIDYDDRPRDEKIEVNHFLARKKIGEICVKLGKLKDNILNQTHPREEKLWVTSATSTNSCRSIKVVSTLDRELSFLQSHAVHHFALIKILLSDHNEYVVEDFGVAPSTRNYLQVESDRP